MAIGKSGGPTLEKLAEKEKALVSSVGKKADVNVDLVANKMAVEISFALSEQIEELDVCRSDFRTSLFNLCKWAVSSILAQQDPCVVFPDCLPGYTLMGFKTPECGSGGKAASQAQMAETSAIAILIDKFLGRSSGMCLVIECEDLLLTLFPVSDMRKNLKMLGFEI